MKLLSKIKAFYIFNALAVCLIIITVIMFYIYKNTKDEIVNISYENNLIHVTEISINLSKDISNILKKDFYEVLRKDKAYREHINSKLNLFLTKKYRYIYLVDKPNIQKDNFRFLADGASFKDDKSEFAEIYKPLNMSKWNDVVKNKKATFFSHTDVDNVWTTYLKPIIINNKIEAILAIDFSLQEQNKITSTLIALDNMFLVASIFFISIFIFVLWFSYIDNKREKQKNLAFEILKTQSLKIQNLNTNLEYRVKEEVNKNRIKDKHLIQQTRLAQMGEMLSMIAHQWRQPLSVISAIAISLNIKAEFGKADEKTVVEFSHKISEYSKHLSSTIDDFRDFFKPYKEKENTTFCNLIESVFKIVEIEITTNDILIIQNLECKSNFESYPNELKQVILNLLKNSQDILCEKNVEKPYIKIHTYTKDKRHILEISDNGGGIPDSIIDKIFDPYFSTKLDKNGTGIGLYMSKIIIEEHCNGELKAVNNKDGAMFTMVL